jgi:hypothetical protein
MNEKPGLEPGFFSRRAAGGKSALRLLRSLSYGGQVG